MQTTLFKQKGVSTWDHLRLAIGENLGVGLSGIPMTGSDIGGFWEDTTPELLVRFTQLGAFLPLCRNHSARNTAHQEPWAFGEPYTALCRQAIELRYRLLPYLVTLAHEASLTGAPIMRPLTWIDPGNEACITCHDQFLLGNDLLLAPVVHEGARERSIVLPAGTWCDMETDTWYQGPKTITLAVDRASMPRFARSGAIIPLAGVIQHTAEPTTEPLTLHIYLDAPGIEAATTLWDDDDHPQAEQRGTFAEYRIISSWTAERITISMEQTSGTFPFRYAGIRVLLHLPPEYAVTLSATSSTMPFSCEWHVSHV